MASETKTKISTEVLRTLHRLHRQRTDLKNREARGPRQIAAGEAQVKAASEAVEEARATLKKARMAADEKQLQLRTREDRVKSLQGKLNAASSNKEYQAFQDQIAADEQANSVLSDEILDALEQLDELEQSVKDRQEELAVRQAEHEKLVSQVEERLEVVRSDLADVEARLLETEAKLPAGLRAEYERMIATRGEDSLAGVENNSCGVCYHMLTPQMLNSLHLNHLVRCPNCGAMLYLPEDPASS